MRWIKTLLSFMSYSLTARCCCCRLEVCKDPVKSRAGKCMETLELVYNGSVQRAVFSLPLDFHACVAGIP